MTLAGRVQAGLGEGFTDSAGTLLPGLIQALVADGDAIDTLVSGADGWSAAFDLNRSTTPAWLGQLAGVTASTNVGTLQQQRDRIRARGTTRGGPAAIRAAAQSTLAGTRTVELLERQGDAYALLVRTYQGETPDPAATLAAIKAALPAGIRLTLSVLSGQLWSDVAASGATWGSILAAGSTWDNLRLAIPDSTGVQTWGAAQRGTTWGAAYARNWVKLRRPTAPNPITTTASSWSRNTAQSWGQANTAETWQSFTRED